MTVRTLASLCEGGGRSRPAILMTLRALSRPRCVICWQTTLRAGVEDGLCLVELRGFEPLTPCVPSRDPDHSTHHETLRSRALHYCGRTGAWWFVRVRRAELLRACCAQQS